MKPLLTALTLVVITLSMTSVSAQDIVSENAAPTGTNMDTQLSQMQKDMNAMLEQIARLRQQSLLQTSLKKMQRQIEDLESTTDRLERQELLKAHLRTLEEHVKLVQGMSESEGASSGKEKTPQAAPAPQGGTVYAPGPMGFPGGMIYGPVMKGGSYGYRGGMIGPGGPMASPPGGRSTLRYW